MPIACCHGLICGVLLIVIVDWLVGIPAIMGLAKIGYFRRRSMENSKVYLNKLNNLDIKLIKMNIKQRNIDLLVDNIQKHVYNGLWGGALSDFHRD